MSVGRSQASGTGTQAASIAFGGEPPPTGTLTEEWNAGVAIGAWVTSGSMNTAKKLLGGFGTPTSALAFGGETPDESRTAKTEEYNGTSWSEVNDLSSCKEQITGV